MLPDGSTATSSDGGLPPVAVRAAVVVLGLLVLVEVAGLVVAATLASGEVGDDLFGATGRVLVAVTGARFLWRGYRSARLLLALWAAASMVVTAVFAGAGEPSGAALLELLVRGLLLAVLVVLVLWRSTRRWCEAGPEPESPAARAAGERRQRRAGLSWPRRVLAALRDDRDARG